MFRTLFWKCLLFVVVFSAGDVCAFEIRGTIYGGDRPMADVLVRVFSGSTQIGTHAITDSLGHYTVSGIPDGTNTLDITPPSGTPFTRTTISEPKIIVNGADLLRDADFLRPLWSISGIILSRSVPQYRLTVSLAGSGAGSVSSLSFGVAAPSTVSAVFDAGTIVTLEARAEVGSVFSGWCGACAGAGACQVTLSADTTVSADFISTAQLLSVKLAGTGSGSVNSNPSGIACATGGSNGCTGSFPSGSSVTLTPTASAHSTFAGWSGACTNTSGNCTVLPTSGNPLPPPLPPIRPKSSSKERARPFT